MNTNDDRLSINDVFAMVNGVDSVMELSEDDKSRLLEYMSRVDEAGSTVLHDVVNDTEYLENLLVLLQSLISVGLMATDDMDVLISMMISPEKYQPVIIFAFKMSIGIATLEEWR